MTLSNPTYTSNAGIRSGLFYLFIGGGLGAVAALLLAPKSGTELRGEISKAARKGYDETRQIAHRLKEKSDVLYHTIRGKGDDAHDFAAPKLSLTQDEISDTFETAEYPLVADIPNNPDKGSKKFSGRRPSSIL